MNLRKPVGHACRWQFAEQISQAVGRVLPHFDQTKFVEF